MTKAHQQYDDQEPPEGERVCQCGHDFDDHNDPPSDEYREMLAELYDTLNDAMPRLGEWMKPSDNTKQMAFAIALQKTESMLASCQRLGCTCRKFTPRERNLDYRED